MPQYRYAYGVDKSIVDVFDLPQNHEEIVGPFSCIGCENILIPKTKAEKKEKHFAHKVAVACASETYLHRLAKKTFHSVYLKCLEENEPFIVELAHPKICSKYVGLLDHRCAIADVVKPHDLTRYYDGIREEPRDGNFVPDLLLFDQSDENKKVYVEIAVTHCLSEEKRSSDNRIIEIPIETDSDLEKIKARRLTTSEACFLNFGSPSVPTTDADCQCAKKAFYCFIVYKNGKCFMDQSSLSNVHSTLRRLANNILYVRLVPTLLEDVLMEPGQLFFKLVNEAHEKGVRVRSCFLCRYSGQSWDWFLGDAGVESSRIFCKAKKRPCKSNDAADCEMFRLPNKPTC